MLGALATHGRFELRGPDARRLRLEGRPRQGSGAAGVPCRTAWLNGSEDQHRGKPSGRARTPTPGRAIGPADRPNADEYLEKYHRASVRLAAMLGETGNIEPALEVCKGRRRGRFAPR